MSEARKKLKDLIRKADEGARPSFAGTGSRPDPLVTLTGHRFDTLPRSRPRRSGA
jgi:hypothetical protein